MSDLHELPEEEQRIEADEQAAERIDGEEGVADEPEAEPEPEKVEYIEFLGTDPKFGTEFYAPGVVGHTVTRKDLKDAWGITIPKDIEWTKLAGGPHRGRMLVPVSDLTPEAADGLANDPMFKRVSL